MAQTFEFGGKLKKYLLGLSIIGLVLGALFGILNGITGAEGEAVGLSRLWSNLLINTYYFSGIAIIGLFFVAAHQLGYGGFQTVFKRIPLAMGNFLYISFGLFVVITLGVYLHFHHLYGHWSVAEHVDMITKEKLPFLKLYGVIVLGFYGLWALMTYLMNKNFISVKNYKEYSKTKKISAIFLLIFGVSSSVLSWFVIMSIDPHWYSTLFGWYNLASYACAGFAMMILIILGLKKMGHLPNVSMDHVHDLGKYMFGFSVFWTYLWFSQFMLIWYANIPEATVWYTKRFDIPIFKFIFYGSFVINFIIPILALMSRDAKRKYATMVIVSVIIIFGHYLDFYQMVMLEPMAPPHHTEEHHEENNDHAEQNGVETVLYAEVNDSHSDTHGTDENHAHSDANSEEMIHGTEVDHTTHSDDAEHVVGDAHQESHGHGEAEVKTYASLGLTELFMFLGFLGTFLFVVFSSLGGKELELKEDPFLKESLHHHI